MLLLRAPSLPTEGRKDLAAPDCSKHLLCSTGSKSALRTTLPALRCCHQHWRAPPLAAWGLESDTDSFVEADPARLATTSSARSEPGVPRKISMSLDCQCGLRLPAVVSDTDRTVRFSLGCTKQRSTRDLRGRSGTETRSHFQSRRVANAARSYLSLASGSDQTSRIRLGTW
jgi:hypothetical protein